MSRCLSVDNLWVEREKNGATFSLHVPRLEVLAGQVLAVVGQSGCGKSTLLDTLALILRPSRAGRFLLYPDTEEGIDLAGAGASALAALRGRDIGYVLQSGGLLSFLSVRDNILLPGRLLNMPERLLLKRMGELTTRLGIAGQLDKKPQHLSGGQRQRVAIVRSLIHAPRLVFADEPTAAVDQETAGEIFTVFREIVRETDTALVVVSHDLQLVRRFADRIVTFALSRNNLAVRSVLVEEGKAA